MQLWREEGDTPSISTTHCVLTREINCREKGKDGWRRDGDGERWRPGREGEEERVKKEKGKRKTKNTLDSAVRSRTTQVEGRWKETQIKRKATWKNEPNTQEFGDG